MNEQLEIEFKTLLSKEHYDRLIQEYQLTPADGITQTNIYFDTKKNELKDLHIGLRMRLLDSHGEITLKTPHPDSDVALIETTVTMEPDELKQMAAAGRLPRIPSIQTKLDRWQLSLEDMQPIGELTTRRIELPFQEGYSLVLDKSSYYGKTDYELEMETPEETTGKTNFFAYLKDREILYRPADNKIVRMFKRKQDIRQ